MCSGGPEHCRVAPWKGPTLSERPSVLPTFMVFFFSTLHSSFRRGTWPACCYHSLIPSESGCVRTGSRVKLASSAARRGNVVISKERMVKNNHGIKGQSWIALSPRAIRTLLAAGSLRSAPLPSTLTCQLHINKSRLSLVQKEQVFPTS